MYDKYIAALGRGVFGRSATCLLVYMCVSSYRAAVSLCTGMLDVGYSVRSGVNTDLLL